MMVSGRAAALVCGLLLSSCAGEVVVFPGPPGAAPGGGTTENEAGDATNSRAPGATPSASVVLPQARLRRLTLSQYTNTLKDLLGVDADVQKLTPIPPINGLRSIAASTIALPEKDVESFVGLAESLSAQVFSDPATRQKLTGCDATKAACRESFVSAFARRAFRRPLTTDESARYVALLHEATSATAEGWLGLRVVVNALLLSPHFLYRVELGEPDAKLATSRRLSSYELASRLSHFLWNSTPDVALLDAAESGALATDSGLAGEAKRLLAAPRAAAASEELFSDYLQLDGLDGLTKLPETYPQLTATLGAALKRETLLTLRTLLFERGGDFRDVFTTNRTFVDAELAKLYGVRSPLGASFGEVELPAGGPRAGLLLQGGFLALHAHPSRSSPTLRGKFVRESLLCQSIPPPPNNVETTLPDTGNAATARQKLTAHRVDPACAGCHAIMDPIGLALEHFDGIGAYRQNDNGLAIDASGELDGVAFKDARSLSAALAGHPDLASCFVRTLLRYARGALEQRSETATLAALDTQFAAGGHRLPALLLAIASDPSFRYVGAVQ